LVLALVPVAAVRKAPWVRQNNPTSKSVLIYRNNVKSRNKKYFAFPEGQIKGTLSPSRPTQKGVGRRHGRWAGCGGR
jgi:hypothetical protein